MSIREGGGEEEEGNVCFVCRGDDVNAGGRARARNDQTSINSFDQQPTRHLYASRQEESITVEKIAQHDSSCQISPSEGPSGPP